MGKHFAGWLFGRLMLWVVMRRPGPDFVVGAGAAGGPYLNRWFLTPWRNWQTRVRQRASEQPTRRNRAIAWACNLLPNLYLHQFLRDDDDRALHDHPSWAVSFILAGAYIEHTRESGVDTRRAWRAGSLRVLPTRHRHRIELFRDRLVDPHADGTGPSADAFLNYAAAPCRPCWTLFLFGPAVREWGFWCGERFVPWREFTAPGAPGETGKGCGE